MSHEPPAPRQREAWIDIAKGIAIVLVVLYHSVMYLSLSGVVGVLSPLNPLLDTFRMPLFFFMSGILGARVIGLPYGALFRKRLVLLLYLYVAWVIAQQLFMLALPSVHADGHITAWSSLYTFFVRPSENLWFIYALPLFFTLAWLVRRWHPAFTVGAAALVSAVFASGLIHTAMAWDKMGRYLVFFLAALWLGPLVRRLVPLVRWWHAALVVVAYAGATVAMVKLDLVRTPFVSLVVSALAVCVGIAVSSVLARSAAFDLLRSLGTRTLPIYLVHAFPMIALAAIIATTNARLPLWLGTVLPIALTAFAIALALALYHWLRNVPGVFTVPVASWTTPVLGTDSSRLEPDRSRQPQA